MCGFFGRGLITGCPLLTQLCGRDAPQVGLALRPTARPLMSPHVTTRRRRRASRHPRTALSYSPVGHVLQSSSADRAESVPRFIGAYSSSPHTVPLCLGVRGPGIAELRSVASRVAS